MTPDSEYSRRRAEAENCSQAAEVQFQNSWIWLLASGAATLAFFYFGFLERLISPWSALPAALLVSFILNERARLSGKLRIARRRVQFYKRGLDRLAYQRDGAGEQYENAAHLYTRDLKVFGSASLFSLLCTARTGAGQDTLARWLSEPADVTEVRMRQDAVQELRARLDLRETIALSGADSASAMNPAALSSWLDQKSIGFPAMARYIALFAAVLAVVTGLLSLSGFFSHRAFLVSLAPEMLLAGMLYQRVRTVIESVALPALDLGLLIQLMLILEREVFTSPLLQALQKRLKAGPVVASIRVNKLRRLAALLDLRRNDVFGYFSFLLLWGTQFAIAIEQWRQSFGEDTRGWLDAVGQFEALNSIAGYAYEHPDDPFPVLVDEPAALFGATGLGHPMLPDATCVRNDIHLGKELPVWIVSGSNMSGKSTFIRAVGLNAVLAWAGAPVRARSLRLSRLTVCAAIQIEDSLEDGQSRFSAEVLRLRRIMNVAGSTPVLFLLDEVLSGTNSRDRRIGAEMITRYLVDHGGIGLVTTHDLSLTEIADNLHPRSRNVYFEDSFDNGRMTFDYKVRPGVLTRSNALPLMRSMGIDV